MQMLKGYVIAMSYESRHVSSGILKIVASLAMCAAMTGCSILAGPRVWRETGPEVSELAVFDRTMRDFMVSRKVSAGALAITHNSRLVFARGYSWAEADSQATQPSSLCRIASLSKPVTSAAVLRCG